ncbi:MAG TPA: PLP-dependent aspartate aminotransferase family protein [Acidimicrobiales bacterium]|nr:PLP-dependent aspartate aminotransferase family protein [Acidimicrobiales bacterium]
MSAIDRSTAWPYEHGEPGRFVYQRQGHPAGTEAEEALGALEGGEALVYGSGTSAVTACVLALCRPGTRVALAQGAYYGTGATLAQFAPWGLDVVEFDQTGAPPDADLVWVEAPSNPFLTLPDWEALRAHPAPVVCDATASTPVYLRALDEGADVVLHSATKYLTGHHDALIGATVTRDPERRARLYEVRTKLGLTAAPDAAAALVRGIETLEVRVRRQTETARELARRLAAHPGVETVRYPGFGGLLSFDVEPDRARRVETATRMIANMTSLGGVRSSMESRHRWEGDRVPRGLLRLSVGLEPVEELWADLEAALAA